MLQVAVHGDDHIAGGVIESGGERRGLAVIAFQAQHRDARILFGNLGEYLRSRVRALVIYVNELDRFKSPGHDLA